MLMCTAHVHVHFLHQILLTTACELQMKNVYYLALFKSNFY